MDGYCYASSDLFALSFWNPIRSAKDKNYITFENTLDKLFGKEDKLNNAHKENDWQYLLIECKNSGIYGVYPELYL